MDETLKPTRPFGYHCGFRSEPRKPRKRRKRKESSGPEAEDDRPYVRPRASARQLIHYRPSPPLSSLTLPPFLSFSLLPSLLMEIIIVSNIEQNDALHQKSKILLQIFGNKYKETERLIFTQFNCVFKFTKVYENYYLLVYKIKLYH